MKTMTVFEARNNFSRTLEAAKRDVVVVTRNGRPVAAIQAIDDDDLEEPSARALADVLGHDPEGPAGPPGVAECRPAKGWWPSEGASAPVSFSVQ